MYTIFENSGEIDRLLISTFGVNVKEGDNAIGFFGTGLKYAIAILIREGCSVEIHSGTERFRFGRKDVELRGKSFEFVTLNDEPMGFTTEVGKKWELWMAYRELYCNAQDEGGRKYESAECPEPAAGITRVVVGGDKFRSISDEHGKYFLASEPLMMGAGVNAHQGPGKAIFYRRVNVGGVGKTTKYVWNITTPIDLTEDRTAKHSHEINWEIGKFVVQCSDRQFIRSCVTAPEDYYEHDVDYDQYVSPSAEFLAEIESLVHDHVANISSTARAKFEKHNPNKIKPKPAQLNGIEKATLARAMNFCKLIGFDIDYPVVTVDSLGENILGLATDGTIYLSRRAFMVGTKCVAGTIIEEYIHLEHGHPDCTRAFQNFIIDKMVSLGEMVIGEPI